MDGPVSVAIEDALGRTQTLTFEDGRAALACATLPAFVRVELERTVGAPAPPPPSLLLSKMKGHYFEFLVALPAPVPARTVAAWLADVLVAGTPEPMKGWWRLLWDCQSDGLVVTVYAYWAWPKSDTAAALAAPDTFGELLQTSPLGPGHLRPLLVTGRVIPRAAYYDAPPFATDEANLAHWKYGRIHRRIGMRRSPICYDDGDATSSVFAFWAAPRDACTKTALGAFVKATLDAAVAPEPGTWHVSFFDDDRGGGVLATFVHQRVCTVNTSTLLESDSGLEFKEVKCKSVGIALQTAEPFPSDLDDVSTLGISAMSCSSASALEHALL